MDGKLIYRSSRLNQFKNGLNFALLCLLPNTLQTAGETVYSRYAFAVVSDVKLGALGHSIE